MMTAFHIAPAVPSDAPQLTEIALAAKRHWNYPERWIEIWRPALAITPDYVAAGGVYAARHPGGILGFYGLLEKHRTWWLEHLWVLPAHIGRGVGRALFRHAVETASSRGASALKIEADPNAESFYLRMGARRFGETISEVEGQRRVLPLLQVACVAGG